MNTQKMAAQDAEKWARAEMFYGKGAGTRRKLLSAEIQENKLKIPGYLEAFDKAYKKQDLSKHAAAAVRERRTIDRTEYVGRNLKGLITGNKQSLTAGVTILSGIYYISRETGFDKVVIEKVKKTKRKVKAKIAEYKLQRSFDRNGI